MKAAVCYELGQPLRVDDIEIDAPQLGEVKVRVAAVAICHSDIHHIRGDWGAQLPVVAGHEAAGIVEEVGENVTLAAGAPLVGTEATVCSKGTRRCSFERRRHWCRLRSRSLCALS